MLVLASRSATRKTLLNNAGIAVDLAPAMIDERALETAALDSGTDSAGVALALARAKALDISTARPNDWIIGADQTLDLEGSPLHKPQTLADARRQLMALRDRPHTLSAAVALARAGEVVFDGVERAHLRLRSFSDAELDAVMAQEGNAVLESVGGYRLEGPSVRLFASVEGDYFTVLGLPLLLLLEGLRRHAPETLEAQS